MCSSNVTQNVVRGATDIMTFGTAEIGGVSSKLGQAAAGLINKPPPQVGSGIDPAQAALTTTGPAQTSPAISDSTASILAAQKKRQAAMAAGIQSTIGTSGSGAPPSLVSQPQAFATGMKTALGA